jgi:dUTP pyrophosphatase
MSQSDKVKIKILLGEGSTVPTYKSSGAAGCDLAASEDICVHPNSRALVKTGIRIEVPIGYVAQVCPRSGLALNAFITVLNSPGIIDSDYRGEVGVLLVNHHNHNALFIKRGDRIAQLVVTPVIQAEFDVETDELSNTDRGSGGWGSTGKNNG